MSEKIPMLDEEAASASREPSEYVVMAGQDAKELLREFASYTDRNGLPAESSLLVRNLIGAIVPTRKNERICRAMEWEETDDYLQGLIKIKCDFAVVGCTFHAVDQELSDFASQLKLSNGKSYSTEVKDGEIDDAEKAALLKTDATNAFARKVHQKWDLTPIVRQLMKDWFTCDSMILYWKTDVAPISETAETGETPDEKQKLLPGIVQITALDPRLCNYDNSVGNDRLLYRLPEELQQKIQNVLSISDPAIKAGAIRMLVEGGIPQEWIDAVRSGKYEVELRRDRGDNWLVQTKGRLHHGLADPSMKVIFQDLTKRKMLREGEFSAAFMMKHFILHITMGESIESGPDAGSRKNWATVKETESMHGVVTRTAQSARLCTNHTVKFNFVYPPNDIWDPAKFATPEAAISRWAGVVNVVSQGSGATGSEGHLGIKQLIADIIYARDRVQQIFSEFFDSKSVKEVTTTDIPDGVTIRPKFDENVLKDARQLLDELKQLWTANAIDPESMARELGRDPSLIRGRKARAIVDNQVTGIYRPIHEAPFGGFQQGDNGDPNKGDRSTKNGRPANEGTTPNEGTREQPAITK